MVDNLKTFKCASLFVLGYHWLPLATIDLMGDINVTLTFKGTENHNITITTNMSQHVEFFHSLIFSDSKSCLRGLNWPRSEKIDTFWHFFGWWRGHKVLVGND